MTPAEVDALLVDQFAAFTELMAAEIEAVKSANRRRR